MSRSDRLHVVLCTDGVFPQAMGGMQRHSRLLAEHLARTGRVSLTVIHPHQAPIFDPALGINEVPVADIDTTKLYLRELWRYSGRVAAELHRLQPDIILAQGFTVWQDIEAFRDRLIIHPHGLEMFQMLGRRERLMGLPFRLVLRYLVRRSKGVISLGGKLTTILQALVRGTTTQVVVLPNAVDVVEAGLMDEQDHRPLRLLFVGRFAFNKGIDVLMAVAHRLEQEGRTGDVQFQLVGDGLVLPTRFEGMPTVVLEAMARSRPIIVSDVGATAELVDATNGFLLPPGDVDELYRAVLSLEYRTPYERHTMGQAGRRKVEERFTWPAVTEQFIQLFRAVAANG
ncbi:MAG: glycosyltransferase family 4 protein [Flavobacteriales bacterium]|nr:glycosyltransferase family 4 protein [Flavobacteriales bacterium]